MMVLDRWVTLVMVLDIGVLLAMVLNKGVATKTRGAIATVGVFTTVFGFSIVNNGTMGDETTILFFEEDDMAVPKAGLEGFRDGVRNTVGLRACGVTTVAMDG